MVASSMWRVCFVAVAVFAAIGWHVRTTGSIDIASWALLTAVIGASVGFGRAIARWASPLVWGAGSMPFALLAGFLAFNWLLFILTLAAPFGVPGNVAILVVIGWISWALASRGASASAIDPAADRAGAIAIALCAIAATLWCSDQQPVLVVDGDLAIFRVWHDVYIHAREISAFAQSHGIGSMSDIRMAGLRAPVYHFAPYMVPAALNAMTSTSAIDAYNAFELPFGITLAAMAAFCLAHTLLRNAWAAAVGAFALTAAPDALQQGFAVHLLSYHFMTQVNLGMFYGLACMALAWIFMLDGCRRGGLAGLKGVVVAWVLLAVCLTFKAHLFVANAYILLIFPCLFFARLKATWRVALLVVATAIFIGVIAISQTLPQLPMLKLDGSGLMSYIHILRTTLDPGWFQKLFDKSYYRPGLPASIQHVLLFAFIVLTSFGVWIIAAPVVCIRLWRSGERLAVAFLIIVVVNYLVMSTGLALDAHRIGGPEEFLNRPHAWAYFVVAMFVSAAIARLASETVPPHHRRAVVLTTGLSSLVMLGAVHSFARNHQTMAPWPGHHTYAAENGQPRCLVEAAQYLRTHTKSDVVMLDSQLDDRFVATAVAERQAYVTESGFSGGSQAVDVRVRAVVDVFDAKDPERLSSLARAGRVDWLILHPDDAALWPRDFLDARTTFACDGYRVMRLRDGTP